MLQTKVVHLDAIEKASRLGSIYSYLDGIR